MDLKNISLKKTGRFGGSNFKIDEWLKKRVVIGNYSYSRKIILLAGAAAIILVLAFAFSLAWHGTRQTDPGAASQREIEKLTARIGGFMDLPVDEQPTLATVADQEKLKGQEFFSRAQNGDKLLIYPKTKKAILYRPSTGKVIEVTNLTSGSQPAPAVTPEINP